MVVRKFGGGEGGGKTLKIKPELKWKLVENTRIVTSFVNVNKILR